MGYKGNGKSRHKITKRQWAKTDAMTSAFAHYGGICQRKIKIELFPKRRYYIGLGKNSTLVVFILEGLENLS